ncbi:hypothetical protein HNR42_003437 [Deinobacterium chartae]|uniref:Calcineurin-like phosphoesterase domain-containing protein n=1 Tax=Deinobacterium chartae TaxID=521158 RepID=A0A841I4M4_9DEIO|nr:metallophosphoesterase [Deinobacterium chartae]MBB6099976.1 hypothetical protein [Deinobacterium chartae]
MIKVIAIGDVHAEWGRMWAALRSAYAVDADYAPTQPVRDGRYQVILLGDLAHPKSAHEYSLISGFDPFDFSDPAHLAAAARAQVRELRRLKRFADAAAGNVQIVLGNHDDAVLYRHHQLGTGYGVQHNEFDPHYGGILLPDDLRAWFAGFAREIRLGDTQFAHAGPASSMAYFDDFFYGDSDTKTWWREKPGMVQDYGFAFGVYGHTVMPHGVYIDPLNRFAMIDALDRREYLELIFQGDFGGKPTYNVISF